ncbi:hypothetical protein ACFFP0_19265 [Rhizobium puerariae]|uniref:Uncharacterized protein n=1 Tax=Rhizobium puerariae TaxID=1585791 RepID=A0ABV6ANU1_9HYPH
MTRRIHLPKSWTSNFSAIGLRVVVAEDRRIRRKAISLGLKFQRVRKDPGGLRLAAADGREIGRFVHECDVEACLNQMAGGRAP